MTSISGIAAIPMKNMNRLLIRNAPFAGVQRTAGRLFASGLWQKTARLCDRVVHNFTLHPAETHETYLQHLWFTIKTSLRFGFVGLLLLAHGVFPFLLTRTASTQIESIYRIMRSRIHPTRRETIESEYEI